MRFSNRPTLADTSCGVDSDKLRMLSKQASNLYAHDRMPLTDAVVHVVSQHQNLNSEHIRRIVEMTNGYAFESEFAKMAGSHRIVNFPGGPADPSAVLNELNKMPEGEVKLAQHRNERFIPGSEGLEHIFSMSKTASTAEPMNYENPHRALFELQGMLKAAHEQLTSDFTHWNTRFGEASKELYKEAKKLVLAGHSPAEISIIFQNRSPHPAVTKLALKRIAQQMEGDHIPAVPMSKLAGRMVNSEHPLCRAFDNFAKTAAHQFSTVAALEKTKEQLERVNSDVRQVIR